MQHQPPIAELVAEALDDQGLVGGQLSGGSALFIEQRHQIRGGIVVEARAT